VDDPDAVMSRLRTATEVARLADAGTNQVQWIVMARQLLAGVQSQL
jgi:hypothetical protein